MTTIEVRENPKEHRFERPIHDDAIAAAYHITPDDVRAAIQYAAALARDLVIPLRSDAA